MSSSSESDGDKLIEAAKNGDKEVVRGLIDIFKFMGIVLDKVDTEVNNILYEEQLT